MSRTYMVQISLQNSGGKVVFLGGGSMEPPPLAPTGVKVPWSLSVNIFNGLNLHYETNHVYV